MFNWFRTKSAQRQEFPDNEAAFSHALTLGYRPLIGALIPALVLEEGERSNNGEHAFLIRLASGAGGGEFWTTTLKDAPGRPQPGDLVGFRIVMIASDLPEELSLIGYLACRLEPVLVQGKGWLAAKSFTPEHLKPALHL